MAQVGHQVVDWTQLPEAILLYPDEILELLQDAVSRMPEQHEGRSAQEHTIAAIAQFASWFIPFYSIWMGAHHDSPTSKPTSLGEGADNTYPAVEQDPVLAVANNDTSIWTVGSRQKHFTVPEDEDNLPTETTYRLKTVFGLMPYSVGQHSLMLAKTAQQVGNTNYNVGGQQMNHPNWFRYHRYYGQNLFGVPAFTRQTVFDVTGVLTPAPPPQNNIPTFYQPVCQDLTVMAYNKPEWGANFAYLTVPTFNWEEMNSSYMTPMIVFIERWAWYYFMTWEYGYQPIHNYIRDFSTWLRIPFRTAGDMPQLYKYITDERKKVQARSYKPREGRPRYQNQRAPGDNTSRGRGGRGRGRGGRGRGRGRQ